MRAPNQIEMTIEENCGYKFYREVLKSPKLVVAPMVDHSDLPFRELCRRYGADLCYTQMIHAKHFVESEKIRQEYLYKCSFDRPLICQFSVNDVDVFLQAIELAKDHCDAIDINLGCPQGIARKGYYGAFLQDDWNLISLMIKKATSKFKIPITCKIRVFKEEKRTIEYAKMIEQAGCYLLTVHGRTREAKGQFTGLADWNIIRRVKEEVNIPVFANGNIQSYKDIEDCFEYTGVDAVMSAEGIIYNPSLFKALHTPSWILIDEYLQLCRTTSIISNVSMKAHLFKMAQATLQTPENKDLRSLLGKAFEIEEFQEFSNQLRKRFEMNENQIIEMTNFNFPLPHYVTQPYFRPPPENQYLLKNRNTKSANTENNTDNNKHKLNDDPPNENDNEPTKKKPKLKAQDLKAKRKAKLPSCSSCNNPKSLSCDHNKCRNCCRTKCHAPDLKLVCKGHHFNYRRARNEITTNECHANSNEPSVEKN